MHVIHQHIIPFDDDAFDIFCILKDQPHAFFLDSSLHRSKAQFSYIGFSPFATVKDGDLAGLKRVFDKYRVKPQGLAFPAGAVGYLGYDGSLFFGFYDTILAVDHRKHQLIISSFAKSRVNDVLRIFRASGLSSGGRGRGLPSEHAGETRGQDPMIC